jgi:uncharacterized membrane protein YgdD (TMEM256/DUF423 family)
MRTKFILLVAMISGALVVALGAVGSHVLHDLLLHNDRVDTYHTAIRYHAFHTVALFCIGILGRIIRSNQLALAAYCMLAGMILFSGSLYLLSLVDQLFLAYITPVGGILLIVSWLILFFAIYRGKWIIRNQE